MIFTREDYKNCQAKFPKLKNVAKNNLIIRYQNLTHIDYDYQYCSVCLEITFEDYNKIVYCEICDAPSHQECYGCGLPEFQRKKQFSISLKFSAGRLGLHALQTRPREPELDDRRITAPMPPLP